MSRFINPFTDVGFKRIFEVLKHMETLQRLPFKARKAVFKKLEEITDIASLSKEERMKYDESIKVYRDNLVTRAAAIEEGKKEANIATARNMKADGLPVDFIVKYTGLTAEEIEAIGLE
ncbi:hypothetical protein H9625_12370 [Phocaeicola sp. Sa1CVN1]|uniref:Rpn family recombination-promoting nuclease/putative transposase n=1 Tax=Phocaeicola intestinalis TaxID=2762212 RepID=A0ABR8YAU4_9BACT|nr:hypothetical protein [Phocaeicola intestinalis]MBD8041216.1 hypothetical protein [Phocaeicola intestinalis]